jgi:hypothetical protein
MRLGFPALPEERLLPRMHRAIATLSSPMPGDPWRRSKLVSARLLEELVIRHDFPGGILMAHSRLFAGSARPSLRRPMQGHRTQASGLGQPGRHGGIQVPVPLVVVLRGESIIPV